MRKDDKEISRLSKELKTLWRKTMAEFNIDDAHGREIFLQALLALDQANAADARVKKQGMTMKDRYGVVKAHPLITVSQRARAQFSHLMKQLNLESDAPKNSVGRPAEGFD